MWAVLAVGCDGGDRAAPPSTTSTTRAPSTTTTASPTTSTPPATTAAPPAAAAVPPTPAPGEVTLHAAGLRLAEVGDAFRVVVRSDASRLTVTVRSTSAPPLRVCPVAALDGPAAGGCVTATAGTPVAVPLAPAYAGVEMARTGTGGATVLDDVAVSYRPRDRAMDLRLPTIVPGTTGAATVLRLTPPAAGSFHATAHWSGASTQGSDGELAMESGPPANRQATARAYGSGANVRGSLPSPLDTTLTLRANGGAPLVRPTIAVTWPSG